MNLEYATLTFNIVDSGDPSVGIFETDDIISITVPKNYILEFERTDLEKAFIGFVREYFDVKECNLVNCSLTAIGTEAEFDKANLLTSSLTPFGRLAFQGIFQLQNPYISLTELQCRALANASSLSFEAVKAMFCKQVKVNKVAH